MQNRNRACFWSFDLQDRGNCEFGLWIGSDRFRHETFNLNICVLKKCVSCVRNAGAFKVKDHVICPGENCFYQRLHFLKIDAVSLLIKISLLKRSLLFKIELTKGLPKNSRNFFSRSPLLKIISVKDHFRRPVHFLIEIALPNNLIKIASSEDNFCWRSLKDQFYLKLPQSQVFWAVNRLFWILKEIASFDHRSFWRSLL